MSPGKRSTAGPALGIAGSVEHEGGTTTNPAQALRCSRGSVGPPGGGHIPPGGAAYVHVWEGRGNVKGPAGRAARPGPLALRSRSSANEVEDLGGGQDEGADQGEEDVEAQSAGRAAQPPEQAVKERTALGP